MFNLNETQEHHTSVAMHRLFRREISSKGYSYSIFNGFTSFPENFAFLFYFCFSRKKCTSRFLNKVKQQINSRLTTGSFSPKI